MDEQRETGFAGRRIPFVAILLVTLGIVLLLNTTGIVEWGIWLPILRLWPLILIALGLNIILAPRFPIISAIAVALIFAAGFGLAYLSFWEAPSDGDRSRQYGISSNRSELLELDVNFGVGSLLIDSIVSPDEDELLMAHFNNLGAYVDDKDVENGTGVVLSVDAPGVRLEDDGDGWKSEIDLFGLFRTLGNLKWDVGVSPDIAEIILDIEGSAADMDLRLTDLNVKTLDMDIGGADVEIALPASAGHTDVYIDAGAADIDITLPEGVAALIESDSALISLDVDTSRFPGNGGVYQSSDYAVAENRVYIRIDAGVSDISIN
ncbi:MAG: DUF5668 domain-containing protein [Dehalococcoidia bacterium]|nr:DUF5668 domain-containing protein [Dehalococcoidia bacterium]